MTSVATQPLLCRLDHIALAYTDPGAAAERMAAVLGLPAQRRIDRWNVESPALLAGATWLHFLCASHPAVSGAQRDGLHHLGFVTARLDEVTDACERAGIERTSLAPGIVALDASKTSGIRVMLAADTHGVPAPATGAESGVERIDHIGIASNDNDGTRAVLSGVMGCPIESTQTDAEGSISLESFVSDKYGVVYHTREPQWLGGLRVVFITVSDCDLELLQDMNPARDDTATTSLANSTRRDQSAISSYIGKRGAGLHHLAFKVADMDRALAYAAAHGARLLDTKGRPGSRRAQIAFMHPGTTGSVLLHFVQR